MRCTIHGYAVLQAIDGFQWSNHTGKSVGWMIRFVDAGLTAIGSNRSHSAMNTATTPEPS